MDTRPSIIAAAAVLAAFDSQLTRKIMELKMNVISFWRSEDKVGHSLDIIRFLYVYDLFSCFTSSNHIVQQNKKRG